MCKSGLSHIITMDLHQKEIQGFFDCPVDNLRASPFLLQYIQESVRVHSIQNTDQRVNSLVISVVLYFQIPDYRNSVIVARNPGSAKKATSYAERLRLGIAVIHGEQKESESDEVDGRYSPPALNRFVQSGCVHRYDWLTQIHLQSITYYGCFCWRSDSSG